MIQKAALDTDPEVPIDNSVPNYQFIESVRFFLYISVLHGNKGLISFLKELSDEIEVFKNIVGLDTLSKEDILDNQAQSQARKKVNPLFR